VRDGEARLVDELPPVEEPVEVDEPRAVARPLPRPPELPLHLEERAEEVARPELGLEPRSRVQEFRLVEMADGLGLAEGRDGVDANALAGAEELEGAPERRLTLSQVGPEADERDRAHPAIFAYRVAVRPAFALALAALALAGPAAAAPPSDPLLAEEWWLPAVGADRLEPPGTGRPVTVIDTGIDVTHPEFAARPETTLLNAQDPTGLVGGHGTAVSSLIGAPADGVGMVGIYPQANLQVYDVGGGDLQAGSVMAGIQAAIARGPGVINLSLGYPVQDALVERAIGLAVASGSLVVAAAGNEHGGGDPLAFPASLPHVLTVAATDRSGLPAFFSSRSRFVDLAAPGQDILVAWPRLGFQRSSGTSFSAPLVAGAAAWIWTLRPELDASQLFEILRRSAHDLGAPGVDVESGFGLLDLPAALAYPAPAPDPYEPNEDVNEVAPAGFFSVGRGPLTSPGRPRATVAARLDADEDPRDVYRVWVPARAALTVTARPSAGDVDLGVWAAGAETVTEREGRRALSAARGRAAEKIVLRGDRRRGSYVWLSVSIPRGPEAAYTLSVTAR
jgi:Subtilase family